MSFNGQRHDALDSAKRGFVTVLPGGDSSIDLWLLHKGGSSIRHSWISSVGLYSLVDGLRPQY